ncbi:MAG: trehalose-phosphatase [Chryseoglobus sp.]|nr:trehalose-phosphatase [Microcella sp.]
MNEPRDGSAPVRPLDAGLVAELRRFAARETVLIALDFDGTLAPEVDVPDEARALPAAVEQLEALQRAPGVTIAFVSGRSLASLDVVVPPSVTAAMIGSHGLELRLAPGDEVPAVDAADRARVEALLDVLSPLVDAVEGAWIEHKPAGFAVHTRVVETDAAAALQAAVREAAAALDAGLTVRDGKNVVEFAVRDATKGDGLRALRSRLRPDAVLFAGDDVTDEDALAALEPGDVGIKVGDASTVAPWRVRSPQQLVLVLAALADARQSA